MASAAGSVKLSGGALISTLGGAALLQGVPDSVSARNFEGSFDGLVLGLRSGRSVSLHEQRLGQLECTRFLAASRVKLWWMIPCWGSRGHELPPETQFLLLDLEDGGSFAVLLPLINDGTFRATLRPSSDQHGINLRLESGDADVQASSWPDALLVGAGPDPLQLVHDAVVAAASLSGGAPALQRKVIPASADVFGWCTWDAFYSRVSARGIVEGLESLREAGVPPHLLIIDDGWQLTATDDDAQPASASRPAQTAPTAAVDEAAPESPGWAAWVMGRAAKAIEAAGNFVVRWPGGTSVVQAVMRTPLKEAIRQHHIRTSDHAKRLTSVKANAKFSSLDAHADTPWTSMDADLKSVVAQLKERFGLRFVFCWHAMHGYWSGVSPVLHDAVPTSPQPTPGIVEVDPSILWNPQTLTGIGLVGDIDELHRDMHGYLKGCGVSGVKVDVQGSSGMFGAGPRLSQQYHESLESSVAECFPGNTSINCMAHSTENLYRTTGTAVTRASDDFYPRQPASHTVHLGVCAYNSLFIGPLLLPDWDMFHSKHPAAGLHAAARAASGGPVYVSDAPARHDGDLLRRLVLRDGSVLRARRPAAPTVDTLFCDVLRDRRTLLKVWNVNHVNCLLFVANVQGACWDRTSRCFVRHDADPPPLRASLCPHDVATFAPARTQQDQHEFSSSRYAVYSDRTQSLVVLGGDEQQQESCSVQSMFSFSESRERCISSMVTNCLLLAEDPAAFTGETAPALQVTLPAAEWDILVVALLLHMNSVRVAPIGLVNMLNAGGSVQSVSCHAPLDSVGGRGGTLTAVLRGAGDMLVYASQQPSRVTLDGSDVVCKYREADGALSFALPAATDMMHTLVAEF